MNIYVSIVDIVALRALIAADPKLQAFLECYGAQVVKYNHTDPAQATYSVAIVSAEVLQKSETFGPVALLMPNGKPPTPEELFGYVAGVDEEGNDIEVQPTAPAEYLAAYRECWPDTPIDILDIDGNVVGTRPRPRLFNVISGYKQEHLL